MPLPPLQLPPENMRALGYRVIDMLVAHMQTLPEKNVGRKVSRADLEAALREPMPQHGMEPSAALAQLQEHVLDNLMHQYHPRFLAFIPSPSNFVSVIGDLLASGFNIFAGTWLEGSGPAQLELVVLDWLRAAFVMPATASGVFVSGGSMANLTSLAVARHVKLNERCERAVVYCSAQTHMSVERALRVLGFRAEQLCKLPVDSNFRLDLAALQQQITHDRAAGREPFCVIANAGATNTGAIDPLSELARFCAAENLWLHADAAYGGAAILTARGKELLAGIEHVDSLALDPHKWLFQPFEIGCVLVREARWLEDAFHLLPEYLTDAQTQSGEVNFCDRGIQLTRGFRALKLWLSLKIFGSTAFAQAIEQGMRLAEFAEAILRARANWEVITPAQLAVLTFRYAPPHVPREQLDAWQRRLVEDLTANGFALISTTRLRGQTVLRMCTINPLATEEDIRATITRLETLAAKK